MSKLKEFLQWNLANPHNLNFKMIVSHEEREETLKEMQDIVNILDTGLTPDEINALRERDTAKVPEKFIIDSETKIGAIRFGKGTKIYRCPECGRMLVYQDHYCRNCGQRLKWEDWPCTES